MQSNNRKIYLDGLRILAIFLVLFTHTGTNGNKLYMVVSGGGTTESIYNVRLS